MMIDCREDPCGECRYCRFEGEPREAELPTDAGARWLAEQDESPCIAPPGNLCLDTGCWDADRCVVTRVIPPASGDTP